ncbi:MAG TPA: response regulator [Daejeonella sp.]|uniref:response regulator n=1 Tax=Daejeonella sp. TaxID=2805397 RepID=UPI002B6CF4EA|nr:response regulator [Daejeonella sp.]MCF8451659.1 response regulator [Pedobacter sp.]HQS06122.1 response regulator [Daejeonella sp.]HQS50535.1 response regulator [Daejeonella sp.]HQT23816.1 response regulator [Daejeonella sp.]
MKSRVFIIDDDPIHQRIAQIMISKHNLFDEYFSYTEAQKALDFLQENKKNEETLPDVILLDLNMPVLDGWDFLETFETLIKEFKKNIRVFIVSSSVDEKDLLRSKSYVAVKGFISKPLSPDIIRSIIETN